MRDVFVYALITLIQIQLGNLMAEVFTTVRRVEFCETDAAGIAHFSSFLCYMEQAEHQLLRSLGVSVIQPLDAIESLGAESTDSATRGWHLSWPRVHVHCDYVGSARFEDVLTIQVRVQKLGTKSVTYDFAFSKDGEKIASGQVVAVCCRVKSGEPLDSMPIPRELTTKLRKYMAGAEAE